MRFNMRFFRLALIVIGCGAAMLIACSDDDSNGGTDPEGSWGWSTLGGGVPGEVYAIEVIDGEIFAGGQFVPTGDAALDYVRRWDGSAWVAVGGGVSNRVMDMVEYNGQLIACGEFLSAGHYNVYGIARWDGTQWNAMDNGLSGYGVEVEVVADTLYAASDAVGGRQVEYWTGQSWETIDTNSVGIANAMCGLAGSLVLAGRDNTSGSYETFVREWDGSDWHDLGDPDRIIFDICSDGPWLWLSGGGTQPVEVFNAGWSLIDDGRFVDEQESIARVECMTIHDGKLIVAGAFDTIDTVTFNNIAAWDGEAWSTLGTGVLGTSNPRVLAMDVEDGRLYVAGEFVTAGGDTANCVAMWSYEE